MNRIRIRQPNGEVGIDWGNPITRGLTLAYIPTVPRIDLALRRPASLQGLTVVGNQRGRSWSPGGANGDGVNFDAIQPISSNTDCTVACLAAPANTATRKVGFSQRYGSGGLEQIELMWGVNAAFSVTGGFFTFFLRSTAGGTGYADNGISAVHPPDGEWHLWGGSQAANVPTSWKDGVAVNDRTVNSSGTLVTTNQKTRLGNLGDYTADGIYASAVPMALTLVWGARALSQVEWAELVRNPWQVFVPIRHRIYAFPSAAPAAGNPWAHYARMRRAA